MEVNRRITMRNGDIGCFRVLEGEENPRKIEERGTLIGQKDQAKGVWMTKSERGESFVTSTPMVQIFESAPYVAASPPTRITKAKDERQKAMDAYQIGASREDAICWGVDVKIFDDLEKKYKGGSIPLNDLLGYKTSEDSIEALKMIVSPGTTYGDWKGVTGPGAQLKAIIKGAKGNSL